MFYRYVLLMSFAFLWAWLGSAGCALSEASLDSEGQPQRAEVPGMKLIDRHDDSWFWLGCPDTHQQRCSAGELPYDPYVLGWGVALLDAREADSQAALLEKLNLPWSVSNHIAEKNIRTVRLPFYIDETEVTNDAYKTCIDAGACTQPRCGETVPANWDPEERADYPVNCTTLAQASAYCEWQGKRLPTEAEWAFAARGVPGSQSVEQVGFYPESEAPPLWDEQHRIPETFLTVANPRQTSPVIFDMPWNYARTDSRNQVDGNFAFLGDPPATEFPYGIWQNFWFYPATYCGIAEIADSDAYTCSRFVRRVGTTIGGKMINNAWHAIADRGGFGVFDMATNLSEWTYSEEVGPVLRGGNYKAPLAPYVKHGVQGRLRERRSLIWSEDYTDESIGFRCMNEIAP